MKAFLWSLCLHIVLLGLLTYHHFAPPEAAKLKSEPPILAYAYQPIKTKAAAIVQVPVAAEPLKTTVPQQAVKAARKAPVRGQHKKAPVVKSKSQKTKPQKAKAPKPQPTKAKTIAAQPQRKPFVPVRKPAMVKPLPAVAKSRPLPALKQAESAPKPVPKPPEVVAAVKPKPVPKPTEAVVAAKPKPVPKPTEAVVAAKPLPVPKPPEAVAAAKPLPVPKPPEVAAAAKPLPAPKPAEVIPAKVIEAAKIAEVKVSSKAAQQDVKQGTSAVVSDSLDHNKTITNKALQSARQGDDSGSASWKEKQKQLALEITATKSEQKPEVGRKVKTFADGSTLIDTNPGCWKVPPPESRKDSIWLSTSIPCKADTTVEQINDILQKRRTYTND